MRSRSRGSAGTSGDFPAAAEPSARSAGYPEGRWRPARSSRPSRMWRATCASGACCAASSRTSFWPAASDASSASCACRGPRHEGWLREADDHPVSRPRAAWRAAARRPARSARASSGAAADAAEPTGRAGRRVPRRSRAPRARTTSLARSRSAADRAQRQARRLPGESLAPGKRAREQRSPHGDAAWSAEHLKRPRDRGVQRRRAPPARGAASRARWARRGHRPPGRGLVQPRLDRRRLGALLVPLRGRPRR